MPYLRILLVVGVTFAAYTLGARAGRGRYRTIKRNAEKIWRAPSIRAARKATRQGTQKLASAVGL